MLSAGVISHLLCLWWCGGCLCPFPLRRLGGVLLGSAGLGWGSLLGGVWLLCGCLRLWHLRWGRTWVRSYGRAVLCGWVSSACAARYG